MELEQVGSEMFVTMTEQNDAKQLDSFICDSKRGLGVTRAVSVFTSLSYAGEGLSLGQL
jgi:hypothetical protein